MLRAHHLTVVLSAAAPGRWPDGMAGRGWPGVCARRPVDAQGATVLIITAPEHHLCVGLGGQHAPFAAPSLLACLVAWSCTAMKLCGLVTAIEQRGGELLQCRIYWTRWGVTSESMIGLITGTLGASAACLHLVRRCTVVDNRPLDQRSLVPASFPACTLCCCGEVTLDRPCSNHAQLCCVAATSALFCRTHCARTSTTW